MYMYCSVYTRIEEGDGLEARGLRVVDGEVAHRQRERLDHLIDHSLHTRVRDALLDARLHSAPNRNTCTSKCNNAHALYIYEYNPNTDTTSDHTRARGHTVQNSYSNSMKMNTLYTM